MATKNFIDGLLSDFYKASGEEVVLKKGDILVEYNHPNRRLYRVMEGTITGNIPDEDENYYELFRATEGMFVGVYSFFSETFVSATRLTAEEDTRLLFIEREVLNFKDTHSGLKALEESVQVIVHELSQRQKIAHSRTVDNNNALKRLMQADKMATLGQLAAGLAHELNNAIMVLERNADWLATQLVAMIEAKSSRHLKDFEKGLASGASLSTHNARQQAEGLEKKLNIPRALAKKLSKTGYEAAYLEKFDTKELENIYQYWELGTALHDMKIAANHSIHVVKSVKLLGTNRSQRTDDVAINATINEALGLLSSQLRSVAISLALDEELPEVYGNHGEFVQIWINLVKNACEALVASKVESPTIFIKTQRLKRVIKIEVTDNGPGIPDDIAPNIFNPNFTTKVDGLSFGLGLGLSIVERLVDSYEGKIKLSTKPGETTFTIHIPYDYGKY